MIEGELRLKKGGFELRSGPFAFAAEGVSVLFGRSGSGKSTLLRAIAGLDPDTRGQLAMAGGGRRQYRRSSTNVRVKKTTHRPPESSAAAVRKIRSLTDKPFGANATLLFPGAALHDESGDAVVSFLVQNRFTFVF